MKRSVIPLLALVAIVNGVTACKNYILPTPPDLRISGWDDVSIDTLCLEVMQSYPQFDEEYDKIGDDYWPKNPLGDRFYAEPIEGTIRSVLNGIGIQTTSVECDATLSIDVTLRAVGETYEVTTYVGGSSYTSTDFCYEGADISGKASLTAPEHALLTLPINKTLHPPGTTHSTCTHDFADASFDKVWPEPILDALTQLWGPRVALQAGARRDEDRDEYSYYVWEAGTDILSGLGREAVPDLIEALEYRDKYVRREAASVLKRITGQDYGEDIDRWQEWWQEQK